ncbi:MAG: helix-turn-helix transcriptional regulator [Burkholderiales bacterium]|nr:helix-turn-helix transcriptional regulator [Burkholderiales bacterium]
MDRSTRPDSLSDPLPAPRPDPLAGLDAEIPPALLHQLVDALDFGVMLLETDGRVRYANRPARVALGANDVLGLTEDRLTLHGPQQQRAFLRALAEVADDRPRMLCLGGGVPGTKLALVRWRREADGSAVLLATLQTGERQHWPALRAYARERRLTEGETDVMQQLVLGDRPPQIAARRGSSEGTVRSQIKSLLEKTGTHSMRELVVEALHLPPMPGHAALSLAPRPHGSPPEGGTSRRLDGPLRTVAPPSTLPSRDSLPARPKRSSCVRAAPPMDRSALAALCAKQFAWPPAA